MTDNYIYIIIALLPLSSLMSVLQVNPYNALVVRAILGAVAALVYAVFGAADVALTEALVGTMLAVTLYIVAVRSSLVMRLGVIETENDQIKELELAVTGQKIAANAELESNLGFIRETLFEDFEMESKTTPKTTLSDIISSLRKVVRNHYLRLELVEYPTSEALELALMTKEVHAICTTESQNNQILIRVHRLFEIMQKELNISGVILKHITVSNKEEKH